MRAHTRSHGGPILVALAFALVVGVGWARSITAPAQRAVVSPPAEAVPTVSPSAPGKALTDEAWSRVRPGPRQPKLVSASGARRSSEPGVRAQGRRGIRPEVSPARGTPENGFRMAAVRRKVGHPQERPHLISNPECGPPIGSVVHSVR